MGAILLCIVRMLWAAVIGPAPLLLGRLSWSVSAAIDAAYDGGGGRGGLRSGFGGSVSRARARGLELLSSACGVKSLAILRTSSCCTCSGDRYTKHKCAESQQQGTLQPEIQFAYRCYRAKGWG